MENNKDLKKIIGYCSDEILNLPYEEITFELLEIACKKKDFFKSRDYITLLGDKRTAQAKLFYKWRILTFAYLSVKACENGGSYDEYIEFSQEEKNNLLRYFINKATNEIEILISNFYSKNYSQEIVDTLIQCEYDEDLGGVELMSINYYLQSMYLFFDKASKLYYIRDKNDEKAKREFLEKLPESIAELDETFVDVLFM